MSEQYLLIENVRVPRYFYGTAWKEDKTQSLTTLALQQGFRGIDTANQRRHYYEAAVGNAISEAIARGIVIREDLFLQTKFTFRSGQDHRLPYDPAAPIPLQVEQSFASSLEHLGTTRIDSFVLHGPTQRVGLVSADWEAWRAMEAIHDSGRVGFLGVSNITFEQIDALCQRSRIRPRFVQNRCYADQGWDRKIRVYCKAHQMMYQGFSLLTANRAVLTSREIANIAHHHGRTTNQVIFRFALDVGMIPLTGTTNPDHMREDLDAFQFRLNAEEIEQIESIAQR